MGGAAKPRVPRESEMRARAWLRPDWTDNKDYPDPKKATSLQWAWEFLRRNSEYQGLWKKLIEPDYHYAKLRDAWTYAQTKAPETRYRQPLRGTPGYLFKDKFHILTYPPPPPSMNEAKLRFEPHSVQYVQGPREAYIGRLEQNQIILFFDLRADSGHVRA
jgi:hypothetical protein